MRRRGQCPKATADHHGRVVSNSKRRVRELLGARSVEEEMEFERENLGLAGPRGDT